MDFIYRVSNACQVQMGPPQLLTTIQPLIWEHMLTLPIQTPFRFIPATTSWFSIQITVPTKLTFPQLRQQIVPAALTVQQAQPALQLVNVQQETAVPM